MRKHEGLIGIILCASVAVSGLFFTFAKAESQYPLGVSGVGVLPAPGANGNVMTSDGTNWTSAAGGGGASIQLSKAWVKFNASTGTAVINASYNVSSITRNNTGDYTINFTNAMADANYAAVISGRMAAGQGFAGMEQHDSPIRTTTQLRIYTLHGLTGTPVDATVCSVAFFGN